MSALFAVLFYIVLGLTSSQYCYTTDTNPYRLYATRTAYDSVTATSTNDTLPGCSPMFSYMVIRHGSRFPPASTITKINSTLTELRARVIKTAKNGTLCDADIKEIQAWFQRIKLQDAEQLSDTGKNESIELAKNFQRRFPGILKTPYDAAAFKFRHSYKDRVRDTAKKFAEGLFNKSDKVQMEIAKADDQLIFYYQVCDKYKKEVKDKPLPEVQVFVDGPDMKDAIKKVTAKLGFPADNLTLDEILTIYESCRFDYLLYRNAPWCAAFEMEQLKVLEYFRDLSYYSLEGYRHSISAEMACPVIKDTMELFKKAKETGKLKGAFRFGHVSNINTLLARLEMYKDDKPLKGNNYHEMASRKWRTSKFCPMTGNVVFVFYKCTGGLYKMRSFIGESLVKLPMCKSDTCDMAEVEKVWGPIVSACDLHNICSPKTSEAPVITMTPTLIGLLLCAVVITRT